MASALSETEAMKNEFISSVSHELRTPLTAIQGWAETLCLDVDAETVQKGMHVIVNETERLSRMVEELLDFPECRVVSSLCIQNRWIFWQNWAMLF